MKVSRIPSRPHHHNLHSRLVKKTFHLKVRRYLPRFCTRPAQGERPCQSNPAIEDMSFSSQCTTPSQDESARPRSSLQPSAMVSETLAHGRFGRLHIPHLKTGQISRSVGPDDSRVRVRAKECHAWSRRHGGITAHVTARPSTDEEGSDVIDRGDPTRLWARYLMVYGERRATLAFFYSTTNPNLYAIRVRNSAHRPLA